MRAERHKLFGHSALQSVRMDADRNLLFGSIVLQADLIDAGQFIDACTLWAARKNMTLAELLVERGWMRHDDKARVDDLLERKLQNRAEAGSSAATETLDHSSVDQLPAPEERYTRLRLHAQGGLGQIWLARDNALGRDVALKELRPEKVASPALRTRFLQEALITGGLEHPGIVPVYELAQRGSDQHSFYTMRSVKGRTLTEAARAYHQKRQAGQADTLELHTLLSAFVIICQTVAYAHARGVLHRDLKGENVVLGEYGEVIVLDWGLAKRTDRDDPGADIQLPGPDQVGLGSSALTMQGQAIGTPSYMAPEQAAGRLDLIGPHTDVYGLGAILYEILTGQPPFTGSNAIEALRRVQEDEPMTPRQLCPETPPALEAICLSSLAKRPGDRCADAGGLAQQVQPWLAESTERKVAEERRARFFALSPDLMCISGFDGYFKHLNPAWHKTLGWTNDELLAVPWVEFVHPDDAALSVASVERVHHGDTVQLHENRFRCKDGTYRYLQWTGQEIVGQQLIYAVARDITELKRAEQH